MTKILLSSGCSYTDQNYISIDNTISYNERGGWPMWPELMAQELSLKSINVGEKGRDNTFILDSILDGICVHGSAIDTVAILWTSADRMPFFCNSLIPLAELHISLMNNKSQSLDDWMQRFGLSDLTYNAMSSNSFNMEDMLKIWMQSPLKKLFTIIELCDRFNYKLIMGQGPAYFQEKPINDLVDSGAFSTKYKVRSKDKAHHFMKSPQFDILERHRSKIIGWPFMPEIGGWDFDLIRAQKHNVNNILTVSDSDFHPNKLGQELFAEIFIDRWNKLYRNT